MWTLTALLVNHLQCPINTAQWADLDAFCFIVLDSGNIPWSGTISIPITHSGETDAITSHNCSNIPVFIQILP